MVRSGTNPDFRFGGVSVLIRNTTKTYKVCMCNNNIESTLNQNDVRNHSQISVE